MEPRGTFKSVTCSVESSEVVHRADVSHGAWRVGAGLDLKGWSRFPGHINSTVEVTVQGVMSDIMRAEFADLELWVSRSETHLRVDVPDSAALYGLIGRIETLGLVLLDVRISRGSAAIGHRGSTGTATVPGSATPLAATGVSDTSWRSAANGPKPT